MKNVLKPKCLKCRREPIQKESFCEGCWYPGITRDWQEYQSMLEEGHRKIQAQVQSGVWGIEELIPERD